MGKISGFRTGALSQVFIYGDGDARQLGNISILLSLVHMTRKHFFFGSILSSCAEALNHIYFSEIIYLPERNLLEKDKKFQCNVKRQS